MDSTTVRTHGNPNRRVKSDPEASWTAKNSARAKDKDGKEWFYGFKLHSAVDAVHGIPLGHLVTTAKRNDSPLLPPLVKHTQEIHDWVKPKVVIADRGYDSKMNHVFLMQKAIAPIIHIRRAPKKDSIDELHTMDGRPICIGDQSMDLVQINPRLGLQYRCLPEGCPLKGSMKTGVKHCNYEVWEHPTDNPRWFCWVPRHTDQWKELYDLRQAVERFFKTTKESKRLQKQCVRGLKHIHLHALMSTISFQADALVNVQAGQMDSMRWMVRKVA